MSEVDNNIMEVESLKAEVKSWVDAAFESCGAWEPTQLREAIADKDDEIAWLKHQLVEAREKWRKAEEKLERRIQAEMTFSKEN